MKDETTELNVEVAVRDRYSAAANDREPSLCCPVDYSGIDLSFIPDEVIQRDYGCGNPAPYVQPGDTVLDLGSGGGKICFATAKIVGESGRIIGVDCNADMLALARKSQTVVAQRLGFDNVEFRYGMIQDLQLDLEQLQAAWNQQPLNSPSDWLKLRDLEQDLRASSPMIEDDSIDCVISNCVLNLVREEDRQQLFSELYRVVKPGGRIAISDVVTLQTVPEEMKQDPELWSGCISGAFHLQDFIEICEAEGFENIQVASLQAEPWQTVEGIEFRSATILAQKPPVPAESDDVHFVFYRGPYREVVVETRGVFARGELMEVSDEVFQYLVNSPIAKDFHFFTDAPEQIDAVQQSVQQDESGGCCQSTSQSSSTLPLVQSASSGCCGGGASKASSSSTSSLGNSKGGCC